MSRSLRLVPVLTVCVVLSLVVGVPRAEAGSYTVRQCDYAAGIGQHDFRWQAAGSPALIPHSGSGCGEFGLAARNGAPGVSQTYPSGGYGGWFAYAPPGTAITRFTGSFGTLAGCCINGLATYAEATQHADGAGSRTYLFQGNLGNNTWYAPSGLQGPIGRSWDAATSGFTAQRVGFQVRCGPGFSCLQQRTGDLRLRARSFDFTLRDDSAPGVASLGGTLLSGGWMRGARTLSFSAWDIGGGLTGVSASFDDASALHSQSTCATGGGRYVRLQPCPLVRANTWNVETSNLPDGPRTVAVRAVDVGGAAAQQVRTVRIDNTAPGAPLGAAVVGGGAWRRTNGFVTRWTNPGGQHAPIARARYSACPVQGGYCVSGEKTRLGVTDSGPVHLPHAGEWAFRTWLEDAAGNADPSTATSPLRLRYDPDPPVLRFLPADAATPARVSVAATDASGLTSGQIELRRFGGVTWRRLPTARHGSLLTANVHDARLRRGVYELRAWAVDAAGNRALVHGPARVLPLRNATRLDAALTRVVPGRRWCRHRSARSCRSRILRRTVVRTSHGSTIVVRGRLTTPAGQPLANRPVGIVLVSRDRSRGLLARRTDSSGRVRIVLRARRSAVVHLRFTGDRRALPSARRLAVHVPAPVTIATGRTVAEGGEQVIFRGRVCGGAIPRHGKLVEIQAHFRGRWRTISAVRSTRAGRWRFAYAFQASGRTAGYRLRARVPGEAGYPFAAGASRPVRVTVLAR